LAVVLFNLGGPDSLAAVRPFLRNLFVDPAILSLPGWLRYPLAWFIAKRRAPIASEIYRKMGGASPLLPLTRAQAAALEERLKRRYPAARVFIAMRYWHPMSDETAAEVARFNPDRVILLPLYPQFSTTTAGSSITAWRRAAASAGITAAERAICCYPVEEGWIEAQASLIGAALDQLAPEQRPRVLFSAHGLPKRVVLSGDPYQRQVEQTAAAIIAALRRPGLDFVVCYQSRVGPLEWIGPSTEEEIERAAADRVVPVIVPVAFVSEHSETLVELDIEYREQAKALGIDTYIRVAAVGTEPRFIEALASLVERALARPEGEAPADGKRLCAAAFSRCPCTVSLTARAKEGVS
jgi:ferrochelatase